MLTTFYFDSELFDDEAIRTQPLANSALLRSWRHFGCLIDNNLNTKLVMSAIKNVPPKYYQDWLMALDSYKKCKVNFETLLISDFDNFNTSKNTLFLKGINTALIPYGYLELFGKTVCNETNFELITPININESVNFIKSEKYAAQDIKSTEDLEEIWDTRFQGLALYTKTITIIDRFAVKNIIEDYKLNRKTSIELFIDKLPKDGRKYSINLYSACDIGGSTNLTELKTYLTDILGKKTYYLIGVQDFRISLCKNSFFGQEAHDRMLKFDDHHVIQIGNGLDIFRSSPILNNTFNVKVPESTNFDFIYRNLSSNVEPRCRDITP